MKRHESRPLAIALCAVTVLLLCTRAMPLYAASAEGNKANNAKVTLCHVPRGNPDKAVTLTVSENAVRAHLAHGDSLGECGYAEVSGNGYLLGPLRAGFSAATLIVLLGFVSTAWPGRRRF